MILSTDRTTMVDGVTTDVTPLYKFNQGEMRHAEFRVADGVGNAVKPQVIYLYDDVTCCALQQLSLLKSVTYNISGVCSPGGRTVYLSYQPEKLSGRALRNSLIMQAEANSNGEYKFTDISNIDGLCILWANMPVDYLKSSSITYEIESLTDESSEFLVTNTYIGTSDGYKICHTCNGEKTLHAGDSCGNCGGDGLINNAVPCQECGHSGALSDGTVCSSCGGDGYVDTRCDICDGTGVIQDTVKCPTCNGTGKVYEDNFAEPSCTLSGTCPIDSDMVYISEYIESDNTDFDTGAGLTAAILSEHVVNSSMAENGIYSIEFRPFVGVRYVLWCTSVSNGNITIDNILMEETQAPCLSGNTMISITCDFKKRLDELRVGDMVMSENGSPTKVLQIRNGYFNHYHTLYTFEDGTVIDETHDHRFYNYDQGFWQVLKNWHIGDHAVNQNGEKVPLVSIKRIDEQAELFGLWTESGSYYANGLLSGVASCNKVLLEDATAEKAIDMLLSVKELQLLQLMGLEGVLP